MSQQSEDYARGFAEGAALATARVEAEYETRLNKLRAEVVAARQAQARHAAALAQRRRYYIRTTEDIRSA